MGMEMIKIMLAQSSGETPAGEPRTFIQRCTSRRLKNAMVPETVKNLTYSLLIRAESSTSKIQYLFQKKLLVTVSAKAIKANPSTISPTATPLIRIRKLKIPKLMKVLDRKSVV